jgi:DNA-directed RNA polymerase subunit A"
MHLEMNAHIPQSYEAAAELAEIAAVPHQIIRPRDSTPVIGVVQDALAGSYLATLPNNFFTRREFMNIMMKNKRFRELPQANDSGRYTGQNIIGTLFAPININMANSQYDNVKDPNLNIVTIQEGKFLKGVLDKDIFNKAGKGILHTTYNDYGPKAAVDLLDGIQNMMETYLIMKGFSVGISDLIADEDTRKQMKDTVDARKKDLDDLILSLHTDLFTNNSGKSNQEEFEARANSILTKAVGEAGKIGVKSLSAENRLMTMVRSGSKGDENNVAQMIACLGQVAVEGKRIPYGFQDRTLPHFKMFDDGAEARGFVESSFVRGLTPTEFFFHAMAGREGLIDTAVKSVSGDTEIVIIEDGETKHTTIGEWIDTHLAINEDAIQHIEKNNMEYLELDIPVFIPTCDADGKMSWGEIKAITRHDPGKQLYQIKTQGGRDVIVTEEQSLLIWDSEKLQFLPKLTPEVTTDDFVPVSMNLPRPPVITEYIDVSNYLPKTEYLYGTDFEIAVNEMKKEMEGKQLIPNGWWKTNNGKSFILPYTSKARLQRVTVRSNTSNIKSGYIYPFSTNREHTLIPDMIKLDNKNGIFVGLFLAEGNVDIKSGYVQITNNDQNIRTFIKEWFDTHGIKHSEEIKTNHIGGTSSCVRGYSTVLAKLLTQLMGHGAKNKHVPSEAFSAPEEFVIGVLNGYFSGDGTISTNSVEAGSASSRLIEGINMLCSRIGIFGKVFTTKCNDNNLGTQNILPTYRISIRSQWATIFREKVLLIDDAKNIKLRNLNPTEKHRNFNTMNDVVMDKIIEINPISPENYPKMYDLTIPSTFNFGLANGLQVRDTAETGYTQRQLIKAMENLMTQHDGTVRDGMGKIVQFCYGEDGLASTKLESCSLPLQDLTDQDIKGKFGLQEIDFSQVLAPGVERGDDSEALKEYTNEIMKDRKMLVEGVFGSSMPYDLTASQNLDRIILNIKTKFSLRKDQQTDLTPLVVLEGIQKIIDRTHAFNRKECENKIWTAAVRFHLAPHKIIVQERFTKQAWYALVEAIVIKDWKAWAIPGELVGIVAAQSIGEPATQMSTSKTTKIVVNLGKNLYYKGEIGTFIDELLEKNKSKVITIGENSVVLDLENDIEILGVSNDERTTWKRISQISRHPANGGMVEVHTRSGRKTTATLSHSFLKRSIEGIVPVLGSDLKIGMRVPVAKKIPEVNNPIHFIKKGETTFTLDRDFGWLCGIYLADGSFNKNNVIITKIAPVVEEKLTALCSVYNWKLTVRNYKGEYGPSKDHRINSKDLSDFLLETFKQGSYTKQIGGLVFNAPVEFIKGVVGGYFDGDGNVSSERQMIRAGSRSEELIRDINNLLGYCDMFGVLGQEKTKNMPGKVMHTINIPRKFARLYKETIGFELPEKAKELEKIIEYNDREDVHSQQEMIDKIPELGGVIAQTGKLLRMPGQSRTFGRWVKKESIGRRTLEEYIEQFKEMMKVYVDPVAEQQVRTNIAILESALEADVFWDEIVDLVYLDDPKEYVYDFTVPGNDSFMVDDNILVHNTLNTFHQAGIAAKSAMTRGVPRLKELLKVTKNPKATSVTIKLKPTFRSDKDAVRQVSQDLELTLLKDIVQKAAIYYDPEDEDTIIEEDVDLIRFFKAMEVKSKLSSNNNSNENNNETKDMDATTVSKWILRFEFDREKMFNKNITMDDIYFVIKNTYSITADDTIYSDYNSQKLVMRIRPNVKAADFMYGDYLASIKKLLNTMMQNTIIRGVPGIRAVTWRKDTNNYEFQDGQYKKVDQYLLDTDGTNFVSIMTHPYIDGNSLYSTNLYDIFDQLGIEATRTVLYTEILNLFNRKDINYRHLGLLCDIMTHGGRPMSVDRYGINKMDNGPLAKASFEETEKVLKSAALFGEMDPVTGVSANIMMGQPIRAGTAFTQILLDEVALPKLLEGLPVGEEKDDEEEAEYTQQELDENLYGEEDLCARVETQMNLILPNSETRITEEEDIELVEI